MDIILENFLLNYWKDFKKKRNVVGFSGKLQPKIKNGQLMAESCVRVYVTKKLDPRVLSIQDLVPSKVTIGGQPIKTDIIEIGCIRAIGCYDDVPPKSMCAIPEDGPGPTDRYRPLVIGPSAMGVWEGSTACTLGGFAINKKDGEEEFVGIVANNHCACRENKALKGNWYIQPSPYDGGVASQDKVGTLWRFVELKFGDFTCPYRSALLAPFKKLKSFIYGNQYNKVDIGFVKLEPGIDYKVEINTVGKMNGKRDAVVGDTVAKYGRTTGLTEDGLVMDTDWIGNVQYSRGVATFTDCILVAGKKFSQGGDSSSFVYTEEDKMYIGNLFAGSDTHTIICKGKNVEKELEVEILV